MKRHAAKKYDMNSLLKSRNVLYLVLFLSVANLFGYLMFKQLDAVAFFIIIGFLTTYFSKNMIIIMLTSVISTFLLVQVKLLGGNVQEGMETGASEADKKSEATKKGPTEIEKALASVAGMGPSTTESSAPSTATPASAAGPSAAGPSAAGPSAAPAPAAPSTAAPTDPKNTSTTVISGSARAAITTPQAPVNGTEKFTQQLNPARYNSSDDDDEPRHKPKINYAATLESAYDSLDKLLSSDAIRNMADDTGRLAEKQQMLMGNIEKMTPIMEKAGSLLKGFDISKITNLMGNINEVQGFDETKAKAFLAESSKAKNEGFRSLFG